MDDRCRSDFRLRGRYHQSEANADLKDSRSPGLNRLPTTPPTMASESIFLVFPLHVVKLGITAEHFESYRHFAELLLATHSSVLSPLRPLVKSFHFLVIPRMTSDGPSYCKLPFKRLCLL